MLDLDCLLNVAKDAAKLAGDHLNENKQKNLKVLLNEGRDIKLQIDRDVEELIKSEIGSQSDFPILGEESGQSDKIRDYYWVVDPLDGTSNYFRNIPICCVAIALMNKLTPVLGVVNDFNNDHLYFAHQDMEAYRNDDLINVSKIDTKIDGTLLTGIPAKTSYTDEEFRSMIVEFQQWKKIRMIGSAAMASAYVASGKAERYQENGIFLWDIAAGAALVNAAGGSVIISDIQSDFRVDARFSNSCIKE